MNLRINPLYRRWRGMINRCTNPNFDAYKWYGARGIGVCERWLKFENFEADMGYPPDGFDLDRIDNNGPYSPENCRWLPHHENCRNTRASRVIEWNGEKRTLKEWSEITGVPQSTIHNRLRRTYPLEMVFSKCRFNKYRDRDLKVVAA